MIAASHSNNKILINITTDETSHVKTEGRRAILCRFRKTRQTRHNSEDKKDQNIKGFPLKTDWAEGKSYALCVCGENKGILP